MLHVAHRIINCRPLPLFFYYFICFFIYSCAASLLLGGLFSACSKQGLLFGCSMQAFSCGGMRVLGCVGLSSCSRQTQWLWLLGSRTQTQQLWCSMWDLPRPGIKLMSPALAGGFFTTEPAGKPSPIFYCIYFGFHQVIISKLYTDSTIKFITFKCLFM